MKFVNYPSKYMIFHTFFLPLRGYYVYIAYTSA